MKNLGLKLFILIVLLSGINIFAKDINSISNSNWETLHLYHGENQRGGPFALMILMWNLSLVEDTIG